VNRVAWLGIDPGVTHTGLALRAGSDLHAFDVVTREVDESIAAGRLGLRVGPAYIRSVIHAADALYADAMTAGWTVRVAVEWLNAPGGHAKGGHVAPRDLVAVAIVTGAVVSAYPDATLVPPARAGQRPLSTYPEALVTDRERARGVNRPAGDSAAVSHAREAWDVAGMAPQIARLAAAVQRAGGAR